MKLKEFIIHASVEYVAEVRIMATSMEEAMEKAANSIDKSDLSPSGDDLYINKSLCRETVNGKDPYNE